MKRIFALLVLMVSMCSGVADGMVFVREEVAPDIPYQRALILHKDGMETLVLQSKVALADAASTNTVLGWVVPVPSVPLLDSVKSYEGYELFLRFNLMSHPDVTEISEVLKLTALGLSFVLTIVMLVLLFLSNFKPFWELDCDRISRVMGYAIIVFLFIFVQSQLFGLSGVSGGVEVVASSQVGIYDTQVIQSADSAALIDWLSENGFTFPSEVEPVIENYIQSGWCFVVAKVRPAEKAEFSKPGFSYAFEGLIDPLIMRFETSQPVYPLALTSVIGGKTEVLIYLLTDGKMACDDRMKLEFASLVSNDSLGGEFLFTLREDDRLCTWFPPTSYFCKFKGKLTSEQMKTDLTFVPAVDQSPYRKHVFRW